MIIKKINRVLVVLVGLRHGTAAAFLGVDDDLRYLTQRLRETWPDVEISSRSIVIITLDHCLRIESVISFPADIGKVRADAGFGVPIMYEVCEELNRSTANDSTLGQTYTLGIGMNSAKETIRQGKCDDLMDKATTQYNETKEKQRLFMGHRLAGHFNWTAPVWVVSSLGH